MLSDLNCFTRCIIEYSNFFDKQISAVFSAQKFFKKSSKYSTAKVEKLVWRMNVYVCSIASNCTVKTCSIFLSRLPQKGAEEKKKEKNKKKVISLKWFCKLDT
ncbi:hypothetical protein WUBG_03041 [Wuchereria bancrofti]|uniref:Uncharacterized protein n=1 Tax=Wuchereria bancrofti TaxID=6293 RepID=J9BFM4_WUCBA|nr:hypothetical protein WUBG_03041 [Wuchereria bancrofti]